MFFFQLAYFWALYMHTYLVFIILSSLCRDIWRLSDGLHPPGDLQLGAGILHHGRIQSCSRVDVLGFWQWQAASSRQLA